MQVAGYQTFNPQPQTYDVVSTAPSKCLTAIRNINYNKCCFFTFAVGSVLTIATSIVMLTAVCGVFSDCQKNPQPMPMKNVTACGCSDEMMSAIEYSLLGGFMMGICACSTTRFCRMWCGPGAGDTGGLIGLPG